MNLDGSDRHRGDGTRCVRGGHSESRAGAPLLPSPVFAAPYHLGADGHGDVYGRAGNPGWRALESAIGGLDGGHCVLLPSGMAAISTVLRTFLRPGDGVVVPDDGYYAVRQFVAEELADLGLDVREVPTPGPWPEDVFDGVRLVLLETPSNPGLRLCDIAELADRARAAGALVAVDNTTSTPLGQQPLALGADLVLGSDTKALSGHSDVLMGHVTARDPELADRLARARTLSGAIPGPFETWLVHRGLGTLDLRLARHAANAAALVEAMAGHPAVRALRWPGSPAHPDHELARRQMSRWNGVFCFELADREAVERFTAASELLSAVTSFGGLHTTIDRRARWGDPVSAGFVRVSTGCEDTVDLVDDVLTALERASV